MRKMNVVKQIVAVILMVILGVTAVSENVAYATEDVQEIKALETILEGEDEEIVSEEYLEVRSTEETEETGRTNEIEVTEAERTSDCEKAESTSETLETTETDAEVWTGTEETEADVEEDVKATVTSNMKSECLPYLLWYCEQKDSIVMGGTTYKDALEFSVFGEDEDDDIRAGFNLNGIYKTISFSVGHIDGKSMGAEEIVLKIYRDNVEKEHYELSNDDIPKSIICNVEGTQQFEFVFEAHGSRYFPSYFGIGAVNFSKDSNDTCIGRTIDSNMKEKECLPYNKKCCDVKDSIVMGGTTYKDALEFTVFGEDEDDDIRAGFNLNGIYKTISFSVGHIDGESTGAEEIVLKIYRDGVEKGSYPLNNNDIPKSITCSVEETRKFEFVFEAQGSRYFPSYFGIGAINFSTEAAVEPPVTVTDFNIDAMKEGTINQALTVSGSITLSDNKENISELLQEAVNNIQWTSSDESIAKVTNCTITNIDASSRSAVLQITVMPYKTGTIRITGKTSNNKTSSCDITIKSETIEPTEIISDISIDTIENAGTPNEKIEAIGRLTLCDGVKASQEQIQEEVNNIVWTSSDESIAKVTKCGKADINKIYVQFPIEISCYKTGTVTITGRTSNNLTADCQITVSEGAEEDINIFTMGSIDPVNDKIVEGSKIETIARFTLNENAKVSEERIQKEVNDMEWDSSDKTIAEVTGCGEISINGRQVEFPIQISCYKAGSVKIIGRLSNGWSRSVQITVEEKSDIEDPEKPTNVITAFNISEIADGTKVNSTIEIYGELTLQENSYIDEASLQKEVDGIRWTSSNKTIAEVTGCGKIRITDERRAEFPIRISCYKAGKTQITGTMQSSKLNASCTVNVLDSHFEEESSEAGSEERPSEPDSEVSAYTVTFDTRNHGTAPKPYTNVPYGSKIKAPSEPQAYGYRFIGWYKDISCKNLWNFETDVVKSDMTLYAGWIISDDTADDDSLDGVLPEDIPADGIPDGLWIAGIKDYVYTGSPIKPQIRVYDSDKRLIAGQDYTIAYKNNTKVNNALDAKKAPTVVVKGKGNYAGTQTATFQILKADLSNDNIIAENMIIAFNNKVQKKVPTLMYHGKKLSNKKDFLVSYPSEGVNAYMAPGTYDIVLSAAPQGSFTGKKTVKMTITSNAGTGNTAGFSINNAVISGITDKVYTGTVPEQNVVIVMNGKNLKEGVDYQIDYPDTIQAGTVNLYITGINAYTGTVKKSFKILSYDISQDSGNQIGGLQKTVTAKYVKGGSKPKLKLTFGGKQMTEGTDYTVTYKNNKALGGNASYTIKGKGNFKGTLTRNFTIVQKSLDDVQSPVCVIVPDMVYSNKAGKCISKPILTDVDGKKLVAGKDYIVGSYTLEDGTALTAQSIVGVNEKVQVEITGIGAYTGTVKAVYRITLQDFSKAKVSILNKAYTGKEITLGKDDISVRIGNAGLVYGTDYEIVEGSYVNNVKKGTAAVTIAGKGNYGGTKTVKFKITARKFLWGDWGKKTILSSGSCGDNVTYVLDSDGVLTISGNGDMDNYSYYKDNVYIGQPWHDLRELVNSVIIEDGITNIGSYAFYYCQNLKTVDIPDTVREIGGYAFCGCNIEYVEIPQSVTTIDVCAFQYCSLKSIELPSGISDIKTSTFESCKNLKNVKLNQGIANIEFSAFYDCDSLISIELPLSVINIEEWSFCACDNLEKIIINNPVCTICDEKTTFPENAVIYGYAGSTAQSYAKKYNREFISLGT